MDPPQTLYPETGGSIDGRRVNHWREIVNQYEKRNAALEERQARLGERLRAMECALPSMLMSAMVSMHNGTEPPKMDLKSILSRTETRSKAEGLQVELVYKREEDPPDSQKNFMTANITTSMANSRFAKGDDGRPENSTSTDDVEVSVVSSQDLIALGRIQELAEQERSLKRYICDLESREKTFCETLERANRLLNDPLECVECLPSCPAAEPKEPLSSDPVMRRLQKLEFYNKRMITSMKVLRQEKNVLIKQTEMLKAQLRSTQEKLGEVQKEVLGAAKVIPVMGEPSLTEVRSTCSCASATNREDSVDTTTASPKTLVDLAEKFEDVLLKAKNHGLCKLSGTIKDAAMKLKQLSESEKGYECICDCPCESIVNITDLPCWKAWDEEQNGPCPNCRCGKFDLEKFGETGDWFCDSCGGDCVCDLVSLDDESLETSQGKSKSCECGCQDDRIACECGCAISNPNEIDNAGDISKRVAKKISEDLGGIICKDCGNCKCGDDHSECPGCVEACRCSCITEMQPISKSSFNEESRVVKIRELQDSNVCGPRCPCNDSDGAEQLRNEVYNELRRKFISKAGEKKNRFLHPCFECEQPEPCDDCFAEEFNNLDKLETVEHCSPQHRLVTSSTPCEECLKFGTKAAISNGVKISRMCSLCRIRDNAGIPAGETGAIKDRGSGDKGDGSKDDYSICPCSCNTVVSSKTEQCLCGCDVTFKANDKIDGKSCPCGCEEVDTSQKSMCDCECAKSGISCDYCCCVDSVIEFLNEDEMVCVKSPEICPCIEESMRESEMDRLAKTLEEDVDTIRRKNNVLRQLLARCACTSPEIIEDPYLAEGCPYHDPAPIRPTISGLQNAVELLREKSRRKDAMIAMLAENLTGNIDAGKIAKNLAISTLPNSSQDFDQCRLYNYLKEAELDKNVLPCLDKASVTKAEEEPLRITDSEMFFHSRNVPAPRDFRVVNQICNDCLLVTWTQPADISTLNGYEILVDGYLASRVRSPTRTEALLVALDTSRPVALTLYSIGPEGSCSNPMRITHSPCPCIDY